MPSLSFLLILILAVTASAATPEDRARAVLDKFAAAGKASDVKAVSRLLSNDCIVIMTEPTAGARRARFFTRDSYLKLLASRYSETLATASKQVIQDISTSDAADVFVTMDYEERARIGERSEWIRSHEYIVMRAAGNDLLIRFVVAEMIFYAPDVPPDPTNKPNKK